MDAGVAPPLAATRAKLLYWAYIGAAAGGSRPGAEQLESVIAELKRLCFGEIAITDGCRERRRSAQTHG